MENSTQSRRGFLATLALLAGSAALLGSYLTPRAPRRARALLRVAKVDIPLEGALVYRESRIALFHRGEEVYALSLVCTHLGCTVQVSGERLSCPCHGSLFDLRGNVLQGPADRPLKRLRTEARAGMIEVTAV